MTDHGAVVLVGEPLHLARPDGVGDVQGCEVPRIDDQVGSARGRLITHEDADQSDGPGDPAASAVGGMAGEADVRFAGWDVRVDQVAVDVERVGGVWSVDAEGPLGAGPEGVVHALQVAQLMVTLLPRGHGVPACSVAGLPQPGDLLLIDGGQMHVDVVGPLLSQNQKPIADRDHLAPSAALEMSLDACQDQVNTQLSRSAVAG